MLTSESLTRDIAAFADPATELKITEVGESLDVQLIREGEGIRFTLDRTSGRIVLRTLNNRWLPSIATLLADPLFANIPDLRVKQRQVNEKFKDDDFIEPNIIWLPPEVRPEGKSAVESLDASLSPSNLPSGKTKVILLDGQAGVGKTSLIQRLLVRRARNATGIPIIHLVSRGSRLYGLNQLLAATLQTLRARFTFDQVPALLRHRLIQIAIDGFDELVDSEGYSDAWQAMRDFLGEVGPGGAVILAGRDTFFDQQVFIKQLGESLSERIDLVSARLTPISAKNARDYLRGMGWQNEELQSTQGIEILREGAYVLRPYFLRTLADAENKTWAEVFEGRPIRSYLVERFLNREADIVRTNTSLSRESAAQKLREVFAEIAIEMAASETDVVDMPFIELVLETVFRDDLNDSELRRLKYKSGSFAFLEKDDRSGYRRFPHTEISHYFLAVGIIRGIGDLAVRRVLRRASLETDFFRIFSESFADLPDEEATTFIERHREIMMREESSQDRFQLNLAALKLATLSWHCSEEAVIKGGFLLDAALVGAASRARLEGVSINRFDVRGADLRLVNFGECTVHTLIADTETKFGTTSPRITHLQIVEPSGIEIIRELERINDWLKDHSESSRPRWTDAQELLWRVLHTLRRRYAIRVSDDDPASRFLQSPYWPKIEEILKSEQRIIRDLSRPASGPNDEFLRIRDPDGLLGYGEEADRIWAKVANL